MKRYTFIFALLILSFLLFAWSHVFADELGTTRLRIAGSGSLTHRTADCAKEFNQKNPGKSVVVIGGHTGDGFIRLIDGTAEIAMASRKLNENEKKEAERKGMKLTEKIVGYGIIAIIVHPSNPLKELTVEQVRKIFDGDYKNWSEVGGPAQPIRLVVVDDPKSGRVFHFKEDLLGGKPFPPGSEKAKAFLGLTKIVGQNAASVGFCHTRDLELLEMKGQGADVKTLSLKRDPSSPPLAPVRPVSGESSYPLMRPYYLYWDSNATMPLVKDFMDFCGGKD